MVIPANVLFWGGT